MNNILMINPMDTTYGSTHRLRQFYRGLALRGWPITYVESNYTGDENIISIPQRNNALGFLCGTLRRTFLALTQKYDILFIQTITPLTIPPLLAAKLRGKKIIVDWDDLAWVLQKNKLRETLVRLSEHLFISLADVVLVPNKHLENYARQHGARRTAFAPHGIDFARFDPHAYSAEASRALKNKLGIPGGVVLGFLASFTTGGVGDLDMVYDIAAIVMRHNPAVSFLVIGGGPLFARYRALAQRKRMERVFFTGLLAQADIPAHLAAVDVALIYMRDNIKNKMKTSLKVGEYLAMNKVVVGHLAGQTKDDFNDLIVPAPADAALFAREVHNVCAGLEKHAHDSRARLQNTYTWEKCIAAADEMLKTLTVEG